MGGTVGDIESQPFIEAVRQWRRECGPENVAFVHCTLVPYISAAHELKTKPTQHSVKELQSLGVQPDFLVLRSDRDISDRIKSKISMFCDVDEDHVFACVDAPSIYQVPMSLYQQGFDERVLRRLGLEVREANLETWEKYLHQEATCDAPVDIAIVGKYVGLPDAYLSVIEALHHAGVANCHRTNVHLVDGENLNDENVDSILGKMDGILVPGGFGVRAFEGKICAVRYARTHNVPFLGICLGLQAAVCEYARDVAGMPGASSGEFGDDLEYPVIDLMPEQGDVADMGGTQRLGSYPCKVAPGTLAERLYGSPLIYERHRHRYEVNNQFRQRLIEAGLVVSGVSPDDRLVEMIELEDHPFFIASQGHPEFKSRPTRPHPLFNGLVAAAIERREA